MSTAESYDEFALLHENADELGLSVDDALGRSRVSTDVGDGRQVSAIRWGEQTPDLVLLHGGGQNAHTWDSVLLALGTPALAIDLPGHGHSSWRADRDYGPQSNALAVAAAIRRHARTPAVVIGMSLGGLTTMSLAAQAPELVRAMLLVDVTPESAARSAALTQAQRGTVALVSGPTSYESLDAMVAAAVQASPTRLPSSLRRGVLHNAKPDADGRWSWRYDKLSDRKNPPDYAGVWQDLSRSHVPITLVRGADSGFVTDEDEAAMKARRPELAVHVVAGAGHSVQGDQPLELARIIGEFVAANG